MNKWLCMNCFYLWDATDPETCPDCGRRALVKEKPEGVRVFAASEPHRIVEPDPIKDAEYWERRNALPPKEGL